MSEKTTVAVLGTGTMGSGIATALLRGGFDVTVWNRTAARAAPLARHGATVADDPADAVRNADVVLTMLFDADAVISVLGSFADALRPGAVWLQAGTVGPDGIAEIGRAADRAGLHEKDVTLLDTPVLGTKGPAAEGTLVVLVAGPESASSRVAPVLDAIGSRTIRVADHLGPASALKLVANGWLGVLTAGVAQSLTLARSWGIDPHLFLEAIQGGPNDSPLAHVKGQAMLEEDFTPQFSLAGLHKDLGLIVETAHTTGTPTPLVDAVRTEFDAAVEAGLGSQDIATVVEAFRPGAADPSLPWGVNHVGLTVPDLDEATEFLRAALGAEVAYDSLTEHDEPRHGAETERQLGLPAGASIVRQRYLQIGTGPGLEMFETRGAEHQRAALLTDVGLEHLSVYVADIAAAVDRVAAAGGEVLSEVHGNSRYEDTPGNGSVYVRAPWGTLIELQTYPHGIDPPAGDHVRRWSPPPPVAATTPARGTKKKEEPR